MSRIHGHVAAVTGAGSGIGRALALGLARRGARLALSDVDADGLAGTAAEAARLGAAVHTAPVDVSDRAAVEDWAGTVAGHYGVVHQIYNNAGVADGGATVLDAPWSTFDRVLAVNLWGVLHGTRSFLPHLIASGAGHVVNISSLNGIAAQPSLSAYCTAKFAVRGFTEALRSEMIVDRHPVRVSVVHPGGVATNIAGAALDHARRQGVEVDARQARRARTYDEKLLRMPAERAAAVILDGVARNRGRILVGSDARMVDLVVRLAPEQYPRFGAWLERRLFPGAPAVPEVTRRS